MGKWMTQQEFVEKANFIHKFKYNYSEVHYTGSYNNVIIICPVHGKFSQTPNCHLQGEGCKKCAKKYRPTTEEYIHRAKEVHGDKYDYSKTVYKSNKSKVVITCKKHGDFEQVARNHLKGSGCRLCYYESMSESRAFTLSQFIEKSKAVHGDTYDYSLVDYKSCRTPVKIICKKHGIFEQVPVDHFYSGSGCPKCAKESHGEKRIRKWLETKDIVYVAQKRFKDLKDVKDLSYDFYLPMQKTVIEFNGEQHYKHNNFFHQNGRSLKKQQYHDILKRNFAKLNKLKMISIPYTDFDKIESILKENTDKTNFTRVKMFSDALGKIYFQIECKYERKERQIKSEELARILMNNLLQDKNIKAEEFL